MTHDIIVNEEVLNRLKKLMKEDLEQESELYMMANQLADSLNVIAENVDEENQTFTLEDEGLSLKCGIVDGRLDLIGANIYFEGNTPQMLVQKLMNMVQRISQG